MLESYEKEWQEYRRQRNVFWLVLVAYVPVVGFVGLITARLTRSSTPVFVAALIWMGVAYFAGARLALWRCPRCGEWFSQTYWYHLGFFARQCVHCGLPKYAKTAEKYIRPGELHLTH